MKALKITQTAGENVKEIAPCTCKVIQDSLEFWISVWIPIPQYWIPLLGEKRKRKSHPACDKRWTKKPSNHRISTRRCTGDR